MPATSRYPGESDEAFKARMMQQFPQAFGMPAQPAGAGQMAQPAGAMGVQPGLMNAPPRTADSTIPGGPPPVEYSGAPQAAAPNSMGIQGPMLESMLGTYGDQMELTDLDRQLAAAEALRNAEGPQMRSGGRVTTAANPLEFLGAGIQKFRAGRAAKKLEGERKEKRGKISQNVKDVGKKYFGDDDEQS